MAARLREARAKAGFETAQAAADAFGWPAGRYRHHENGTRGFDPATAARYGAAFKVNPGWLLGLDKVQAPKPIDPTPEPTGGTWLEVSGAVAAGIWREQTEWSAEERYKIEVGPSPVPGAERFAVQVEGNSMDRTIPPGSVLDCIRVSERVTPEAGDLVIVERYAHDLTEMTVKRLQKGEEGWELHPESTRPEFQEVIKLGMANPNYFGDDHVRIIGIVLDARQIHFRRRR